MDVQSEAEQAFVGRIEAALREAKAAGLPWGDLDQAMHTVWFGALAGWMPGQDPFTGEPA